MRALKISARRFKKMPPKLQILMVFKNSIPPFLENKKEFKFPALSQEAYTCQLTPDQQSHSLRRKLERRG